MSASAFETAPAPYDRLSTPVAHPTLETVAELTGALTAVDTATDTEVPATADVIYLTTGNALRRAPLPALDFVPLDGSDAMTGTLEIESSGEAFFGIGIADQSEAGRTPAGFTSVLFPLATSRASHNSFATIVPGDESSVLGAGSIHRTRVNAPGPNSWTVGSFEGVYVDSGAAGDDTWVYGHYVCIETADTNFSAGATFEIFGVFADLQTVGDVDSLTAVRGYTGPTGAVGSASIAGSFSANGDGATPTVIGVEASALSGADPIAIRAWYGRTHLGDWLTVVGATASNPVIRAKAAAAQTGNIVELLDSSDAVLSRFNKGGYFVTKLNSAPADGDLAAGEMALWFDPTNGAAKFKIKAKSLDGTVVSGETALA